GCGWRRARARALPQPRGRLTTTLTPYAEASTATAASTVPRAAHAVPTNSAAYTPTNKSGASGKSGTRNGALGRRARSRKRDSTVKPSMTMMTVTARPRSDWNVPVAASSTTTAPTSSVAAHGVPPRFTRPRAAGRSGHCFGDLRHVKVAVVGPHHRLERERQGGEGRDPGGRGGQGRAPADAVTRGEGERGDAREHEHLGAGREVLHPASRGDA